MRPAVGSRWVHRRGGRVCVVDAVERDRVLDVDIVRYHYEQTAGSPPGRVRRARGTPPQTMPIAEWRSLFTVEARPKEGRRGSGAMPWLCHAKPAAKGVECAHFNDSGGIMHAGIVCCAGCGCTKKASDDRLAIKQAISKERRQR